MGIEVNDIALPVETVLKEKYRITEIYYLGQFGIVYFADDFVDEMSVVIKEFFPYSISNRDMDGKSVICKSNKYKKQYEKYQGAFYRECQYVRELQNLRKPYEGCVVRYLDSFEENNSIYLVTERIKGRSLQDYIENGEDFSIRDTIYMLVQIVRQVHKRKIIHCDIKPSNILLREDGRVVLIDFGSSCRNNDKSGEVACVSRSYSAPELYHEGRVDYRADIYSIGAVLYYLLTDYQLPEPDEFEESEIPAISEFIQIPGGLERVIHKMLSRDKKKRLKSLFLLQIILKF